MVYMYNGILFTAKSCHLWQHGWNWRLFCKVTDAKQRKTDTAWYHLYVGSKKKKKNEEAKKEVKLTETKWMVVARR